MAYNSYPEAGSEEGDEEEDEPMDRGAASDEDRPTDDKSPTFFDSDPHSRDNVNSSDELEEDPGDGDLDDDGEQHDTHDVEPYPDQDHDEQEPDADLDDDPDQEDSQHRTHNMLGSELESDLAQVKHGNPERDDLDMNTDN